MGCFFSRGTFPMSGNVDLIDATMVLNHGVNIAPQHAIMSRSSNGVVVSNNFTLTCGPMDGSIQITSQSTSLNDPRRFQQQQQAQQQGTQNSTKNTWVNWLGDMASNARYLLNLYRAGDFEIDVKKLEARIQELKEEANMNISNGAKVTDQRHIISEIKGLEQEISLLQNAIAAQKKAEISVRRRLALKTAQNVIDQELNVPEEDATNEHLMNTVKAQQYDDRQRALNDVSNAASEMNQQPIDVQEIERILGINTNNNKPPVVERQQQQQQRQTPNHVALQIPVEQHLEDEEQEQRVLIAENNNV